MNRWCVSSRIRRLVGLVGYLSSCRSSRSRDSIGVLLFGFGGFYIVLRVVFCWTGVLVYV